MRSPERGLVCIYVYFFGRRVTTTVFCNGPVPPPHCLLGKIRYPFENDIWLLVTNAAEAKEFSLFLSSC